MTREESIKAMMVKLNKTEAEATVIQLEFEKSELEKKLLKLNAETEEVKREIAKIDGQINFINKRGLPKNNAFEQMIFMMGLDIDKIESMAKK